MMLSKKRIGRILGPLAFVLIQMFFNPEGLGAAGVAILAVTTWVAIWWITEAIPVEANSLLPIILFPVTGALDLSDTCAAYGHKFIFLFVGGFILAIAIEKWNLHRRISLSIITIVGANLSSIILGFMISTAFLSMWISNTATTVMMLPIGMAIVSQVESSNKPGSKQFGKALMLSIAYAASIGGIATLIGTPPNIILAGVIEQTYQVELSFLKWFSIGLPIAVVLLFLCWRYLTKIAFDFKEVSLEGGKALIVKQLKDLGTMSSEEKKVLVVFILTALAWIFRSVLLNRFIPAIDDTIIAIAAALLLFVLPSSQKGKPLLLWEDAVKLPWGVLLLFGGGIAIAEGFQTSGLAEWVAIQLNGLNSTYLIIVLLILIASVNFLTEITSNLATASVLLPLLAPLALAMDVHPYVLMVGCTLAASCAFMLPVATPPNAIVFGSGKLQISDMVRAGVWMNVVSIVVLTLAVYGLLPLLWDIDISVFPKALGDVINNK